MVDTIERINYTFTKQPSLLKRTFINNFDTSVCNLMPGDPVVIADYRGRIPNGTRKLATIVQRYGMQTPYGKYEDLLDVIFFGEDTISQCHFTYYAKELPTLEELRLYLKDPALVPLMEHNHANIPTIR